jgi:hypothetical protein
MPSRSLSCSLFVALVALSPALARADRPPAPVRHAEATEAPRTEGDDLTSSYFDTAYLTLRWHPIQLISGVVLVGAEVKILRNFTALVHVGGGRVKTTNPITLQTQRRNYGQFDLDGRYYLFGDMTGGVYGSAGFAYYAVDTEQIIASPLMNMSSGLHVGPSIGGNYTSPIGVGVDLQFLFRYRVYRPEPSIPTPTELGINATKLIIGAALALGYTF